MTPARFAELALAYGGDVHRWPEAERREAETLAASPGGGSVLSQAKALDDALDRYEVAAPSADLQRRLVTAMLQQRAARTRIGRWLSGFGAVGVLGAGAAAGAATVALLAMSPALRSGWEGLSPLYEQSSFGTLALSDENAASPART